MSENHYPYKLSKVQIWFAAQPKVASEDVSEFCYVMSPEDAIKYLESHLTKRVPDRLWLARGEGVLLGLMLAFFVVALAFGGR